VDVEIPVEGKIIQIQVTRLGDRGIWKELNREGKVNKLLTIDEASKEVFSLINKKAQKTSPYDRPTIMLALDATEPITYALPPMIQEVCKEYGKQIKELGFEAVWVVGPIEGLVFRIDTDY
jgi:hypothetical protein